MTKKYTLSKKAATDVTTITLTSLDGFGSLQTDKYMAGLKDLLEAITQGKAKCSEFINKKTERAYLFSRYLSHVVYFRKRKNDVFIVRILHRRMLPEKHLS